MNFLSIRKVTSRSSDKGGDDDDDHRGRTRSLFGLGRSSHSHSRSRSRGASSRRDPSAEGIRADEYTDGESENEGTAAAATRGAGGAPQQRAPMPSVTPSNAFDDDSDGESDAQRGGAYSEDDEDFDFDDEDIAREEQVERNTEANASADTPYDFLSREGLTVDGLEMEFPGEGPNLLPATDPLVPTARFSAPSTTTPSSSSTARVNPRTGLPARRKSTRSAAGPKLELKTGRPVFEKNRCTITLTHGDPERVIREGGGKKRSRKYLVASDLSEESAYAVQWAVGTVLREGDECIIVSVMETDTKLDSDDMSSSSARQAKQQNQRDRQAAVLQLVRIATALIERTRLNIRVVCQAIHAKTPRHMLVDMIDFLEPTLVLVGSRGLTRLKGMLLGSTSNYLVQKSSAPVMVTRRPLRVSRTVHRKLASLDRTPRVALADAQIEKESHGQAVEKPEEVEEGEGVREEVRGLTGGEQV